MKSLRDLRSEKGLTQDQLASLAGISQGSLSQYETGDVTPSLANVKRLSSALEVSVEVLIRSLEPKGEEQ